MQCKTFLPCGGGLTCGQPLYDSLCFPPLAYATASLPLWWALLHIKAAEGISAMPACILHNIFVWLLNQLRNHRHGHAHLLRRPFPSARCSSRKFSSLRRLTRETPTQAATELQRARCMLQQTMQQATIAASCFRGVPQTVAL